MVLLLLLLAAIGGSHAERVSGQQKKGACECALNLNTWSFPALKYAAALQLIDNCQHSVDSLDAQLRLSNQRLPDIQALIQNLTARLKQFKYLTDKGQYQALLLQQLALRMKVLEQEINSLHMDNPTTQTLKLSKELASLQTDVERLHRLDTNNMKTVREKLRYLKNGVESCKSIPSDFRSNQESCSKGLMKNISSPVVTKISPYGKSYPSGSWGKQALQASPGERESYWVQPLVSSHYWGNTLRLYSTYEDFMTNTPRDFAFAPSHTHSNSIEGPSGVLHGEAFYYHCYRSTDICRYDLTDKTVKRVTLPGNGLDFNNKFPYCYYECRAYSDVDLEADETGLWAIYATLSNHGNLVVSRLAWDGETLNVTHTWETKVFKKAVTNAFMVCGVLYATRYVNEYREEVFYAFDTATGREDSSLQLPLEKVAKGVASLSYNPTDRRIYMFNDAYLLAYEARY